MAWSAQRGFQRTPRAGGGAAAGSIWSPPQTAASKRRPAQMTIAPWWNDDPDHDPDGRFYMPYLCSFITCPAVNAKVVLERDPSRRDEIRQVMSTRTAKVLAIAAITGTKLWCSAPGDAECLATTGERSLSCSA